MILLVCLSYLRISILHCKVFEDHLRKMLQELMLAMKKNCVLILSALVTYSIKSESVICLSFSPSIAKYSVPKYLVFLNAARDANKELDPTVTPMIIDPTQFHGSLHKGKDDTDTNCWTSPSGTGFMIRGKTYLKDNMKVGFALLLSYL